MKENELISKKELLLLTGISYGQLYRWKRQNLIPDAWFMKQSSFTGQETFFPRDKILQRVAMIIDYKDQYSLEELADLFNPELNRKTFQPRDVKKLTTISQRVADLFRETNPKGQFTFVELVGMELISRIGKRLDLPIASHLLADFAKTVQGWLPDLKDTSYRAILFQSSAEQQLLLMLVPGEALLYSDHKIKEVAVFHLDEIAKELNLIIREVFGES